MAKKKEETVEATVVDTPVVVEETPVVETTETVQDPGNTTRAFRQ